jgi:hypothetical protein
MLESVTGGEVRGRYSIVGIKPDLIWQCHGTQSHPPILEDNDVLSQIH